MASPPSVAIVGGGVIGLSCAVNAAELGCKSVTLIEKSSVASGSSSLSVGVFTRQYINRFDIELRIKAYEGFLKLEKDHGLAIVRNGFVRLAHDEASLAQFYAGAERQRELGIDDVNVLSQRELGRLIPDLACLDVLGALYCPTDGYCDGHALCMIYAKRALGLGARILVGTRLVSAHPGKRCAHHLVTTGGAVECDVVINAAGAWAGRVGEMLGAPVEIVPQRHQVCIGRLTRKLQYVMPTVMDYVPGTNRLGLYFRSDGDKEMIAGLHTNDVVEARVEDPEEYNRSTDSEYTELVASELARRLPGLADMGLKGGWSGLYPSSHDGKPVIGPFPEQPAVIAACGLSGVGINLSPIVGRLALEWAVYGEPRAVDGAEELSPSRFQAVGPVVSRPGAG